MKKIFLVLGIIITTVAILVTGGLLIKSKTYNVQKPVATIKIQGYDKPIKVELDPQSAPNAVANFIKLANNGFYNNYKMKISESEISIDDEMEKAKVSNIMEYPQSDYVYGIKGDFLVNKFEDNKIKHKKGVITMNRNDYSYFGYAEEGYNSANSDFQILTKDMDTYNGYYAGFGNVVEGIDVLDAIAATRVEEKTTENETTENSENKEEEKDVNIVVIESISVDTFGIDYGTPEYVNYDENYKKVEQIYNQYFGGNSGIQTVTQ
ncbi:MAG: peptidylprolyl isomerase [Clostridiales bacterium]|nr:peptidylprolyl isomerase [Clostridiales bacterium]